MAFEITKTFVVKAAPSDVWAFLVDPHMVARCMPGATVTEKLDDKTYAGTMTVKVGPVQASYRGKIVFEQLNPVTHTATIVATGQDVRGKGGADLRLRSSLADRGQGETEVTAVSRVNVSGILAQMGRGMVEDVGDQMFQVFSQRMRSELEAGAPAAPSTSTSTAAPPPSAPPGDGASVPRAPSSSHASAASSPPTPPAPLDVGALGARVAGRAAARSLRAPTPLWVALLLVVAVVYLLIRR